MNARKRRKIKSKTFGEIVQVAWLRSGMTQREFAKALGLQQPRVAEIFIQPTMTELLLERCAAALGVVIDVRLIKRRSA